MPPRFKLIRYFSLACGIAFACVSVFLALFFRQNAVFEVITTAEVQNIVLARSFANTIWPRYAPYIRSVATDDPVVLRNRKETDELHETLKILTYDIPVLKVKIYNLEGVTVYSGEASQIGEHKGNNPGFIAAAGRGVPASKMSFRETFSGFSRELFNKNVVETYVPVGPIGVPPQGVFELYTAVSPLMAVLNREANAVLVGLVGVFLLLFGFLFMIVRRGERIMGGQIGGIENTQGIEVKNSALESESADRRRADGELLLNQETLTRLYEITADRGQSSQQIIDEIIELGGNLFRLPLGVVGRADGENYVIAYLVGPKDAPPVGTTYKMMETFCQHALIADAPVGYHCVKESRLAGEPCYQIRGFEAYLGTPIHIAGNQFWTLCFIGSEARVEPFSESELSLLQLLATWIGGEIHRCDVQLKLKKTNENFGALIENFSSGIYIHVHFRPLYANQTLLKMFGFESLDEFLSLESTELLLAPEERKRIRGYHEARLANKPAPRDYEFRALRKDGTDFSVDNRSFAIDWAGQTAVCTTVFDLTEREKDKQVLRMKEQLLLDAIESISDGVVLYDADDRLVLCNGATLSDLSDIKDVIVPGAKYEDIARGIIT